MTTRETYQKFSAFQHKIETKYTPQVQVIFAQQATTFNNYAKETSYTQAAAKIHDFFPAGPLLPIINTLHRNASNWGVWMFRQLRNVKSSWDTMQTKVFAQRVFNTPTEQIGNSVVSVLRMSLVQNVHRITDTVKDNVLAIIQKGNLEGWGYDKTAAKIADEVGSKWRALRIVRTESIKASNLSAIEGARLTGFEMTKTWVSAHDNRVRGNPSGKYPESQYDHWDLDKTTLPLEGKFLSGSRATGGESSELEYPGDPNGVAGTIVNCRCTLVFNVKRDANGRPIRNRPRQAVAA